jgi:16S rRNA (adenine1518-N6/adenine1519-N6)-dimethyltransferase
MHPHKKYGQHFLESAWAEKLVDAIEPRPGDSFLEIGPGTGALTLRLAPRVAHLTAVDVDARMIDALRPRVPSNVTLLQGDVLELDLASRYADTRFRVAGNLPYNISSPILFALVNVYRGSGRLIDATLMVQREVADRIRAAPGTRDYGVLAILIGLHADARVVLQLPPGAFRPVPRVHSSVIALRFRPPEVPLHDEATFEAMVRAIFTQRRKMVGNALKPFAEMRGRGAIEALAQAQLDPSRRPETLQLEELARLADAFSAA